MRFEFIFLTKLLLVVTFSLSWLGKGNSDGLVLHWRYSCQFALYFCGKGLMNFVAFLFFYYCKLSECILYLEIIFIKSKMYLMSSPGEKGR